VLAGWNYGLGRTVAFTTDGGTRWARDWTGWPDYDKFFSQIVRWTMRPSIEDGNFTAAVDVREGRVRLIVNALDTDDEFLNFLNVTAAVVDPEMKSYGVEMRQTAPGRYVGEFAAPLSGSYFATISPGGGRAPISLGVSVPASAEYHDLETNQPLLESLAALRPQGGQSGQIIDVAWQTLGDQAELAELHVDTFRRTLLRAASYDALWPLLLVIAACAFFADVFVRRVTIDFHWLIALLAPVVQIVLRHEPPTAPDERIARLRSRKQEVDQRLDQQRAATRFEPQSESAGVSIEEAMTDALRGGGSTDVRAPSPEASLTPDAAEADDDYTARLLKARDRIRRQHRPE
jgi:hypothetical protein